MGYTHYWENNANVIPVETILIIREIVDQAYADGVIQVEHDRKGLPISRDRVMRVNGVSDDGHEAFRFDTDNVDRTHEGHHFAFCRTNQKPYDAVVMKVLILLKWAFKNEITLRSDGSFHEEWEKVRDEMRERHGNHTCVKEELTVG